MEGVRRYYVQEGDYMTNKSTMRSEHVQIMIATKNKVWAHATFEGVVHLGVS